MKPTIHEMARECLKKNYPLVDYVDIFTLLTFYELRIIDEAGYFIGNFKRAQNKNIANIVFDYAQLFLEHEQP